MKIAIYHGYPTIHFEMLGYIIEFCKDYNIELDIYAHYFLDWREYYAKTLNYAKEWINPNLFNPEEYNYIFLLTDDDMSYKEELLDSCGTEKVICIDHGIINERRKNVLLNIKTRTALKFKNDPFWALPCYKVIDDVDYKIEQTKQDNKINIVCIGYNNTPKTVDNLKDIFINYDDITFHIINHYIFYKYDDTDNIKEYIGASVKTMTHILTKADYVLCLENNQTKDYVNRVMSASIPLGLDFGAQIIMPKIWNNAYQFKSTITYVRGEQKIKIEKLERDAVVETFKERERMIHYRNMLFKGIMRI